jgi:hypothetical protein
LLLSVCLECSRQVCYHGNKSDRELAFPQITGSGREEMIEGKKSSGGREGAIMREAGMFG